MKFNVYYTINDIKRMVKHTIQDTYEIVLNSAIQIDDDFASYVVNNWKYAECIEETRNWFD